MKKRKSEKAIIAIVRHQSAELRSKAKALRKRSFQLASRAGGLYIFDSSRLDPQMRAKLNLLLEENASPPKNRA